MVYNSSRGFVTDPLVNTSAFSFPSTLPVDPPWIHNKCPCLRTLSSLMLSSGTGLHFHSRSRRASLACDTIDLQLPEALVVPINKCALSCILSPLVSLADSMKSIQTNDSVATSARSTAAALLATSNKAALSFILSSPSQSLSEHDGFTRFPTSTLGLPNRKHSSILQQSDATTSRPGNSSTDEAPFKKATRLCDVDGCTKLSKHNKRCWRHGGSVKCKVADCDNRAKSKGVCWSHGGGTQCSSEKCDTIAVSKGFCWTHGGGKRCLLPDCAKPAYERTENYCKAHFKGVTGAGE